jgi:AraC family transcriptional regulator of arabinose operon
MEVQMMLWQEPHECAIGISVHRIGTEQGEPPGFVIDRPKGCGEFDFLHFSSGVTALVDGRRKALRPGSCLLYGPTTPQWYSGGKKPFTHDWFHFVGPAAAELVKRNRLPVGKVFQPRETHFITDAVQLMYLEVARREKEWQRAVVGHLELLFIRLQRSLASAEASMGRVKLLTRERVRNVRLEIQRTPERAWGVEQMATSAALSRSRFSVLYREFFGVSPLEDLTAVRLQRARWLLSNSAMTVDQVARNLGFEDPAYFNRLFTKRVGVTPGRYR